MIAIVILICVAATVCSIVSHALQYDRLGDTPASLLFAASTLLFAASIIFWIIAVGAAWTHKGETMSEAMNVYHIEHGVERSEKRFVIDPTSDLSQKHSFAIAMATLIHNGFNLCEPITMTQEKEGIGNIVFTQGARK